MAISACHENVREAMEETRGERKGDNKDEQERRRPMWKPQEESWAALVKKQAQGDSYENGRASEIADQRQIESSHQK